MRLVLGLIIFPLYLLVFGIVLLLGTCLLVGSPVWALILTKMLWRVNDFYSLGQE